MASSHFSVMSYLNCQVYRRRFLDPLLKILPSRRGDSGPIGTAALVDSRGIAGKDLDGVIVRFAI